MERRARQQGARSTWTEEWARQVAKEYEELGTLARVAKRHGVTRERIRQILERGRAEGVIHYQTHTLIKRARLIRAVEAAQEGCASWRELGERVYGEKSTPSGRVAMVRRIVEQCVGKAAEYSARFKEEKRQRLVRAFREECRRLKTSASTELQLDRRARNVYHQLARVLGTRGGVASIAEVRAVCGIQDPMKTATGRNQRGRMVIT